MTARGSGMEVVIHVAVARNGVIGHEGGMPWKLSTDLRRFKASTMGNPIVMGRKTFESLGKPLPGRLNIVVTRDDGWSAEGARRAGSLDEALAIADDEVHAMPDARQISVIGGGEIYRLALPLADRLEVTHVEAGPEGDTHFPTITPEVWVAVSEQDFPAGERDSHATRFVVYRRRT